MNKRIRDALMPVVTKLAPAARIVDRVASLAVHIQKPTLLSMTGLVARGLATAQDVLGGAHAPGVALEVAASRSQVANACTEAGATVKMIKFHDNSGEYCECQIGAKRFWINSNGSVSMAQGDHEFVLWLRQALDRTLPAHVEVRRRAGRPNEMLGLEAHQLCLTQHKNEQALQIARDTLPLLDGGRCILLDGKPGVGKTTLAQIIAREAGLGRTVMVDAGLIGDAQHSVSNAMCAPSPGSGDLADAIQMLSPGVAIVDDIDKVHLSLSRLEALRAAARLVVLTANNGQYDEVLDGALMRAGRIDEVFTIQPVTARRETPFDRLADDEWAEVSQWPVAYLNEVRKRLSGRPGDLRLDDLRTRLTRRTRSGQVLS